MSDTIILQHMWTCDIGKLSDQAICQRNIDRLCRLEDAGYRPMFPLRRVLCLCRLYPADTGPDPPQRTLHPTGGRSILDTPIAPRPDAVCSLAAQEAGSLEVI